MEIVRELGGSTGVGAARIWRGACRTDLPRSGHVTHQPRSGNQVPGPTFDRDWATSDRVDVNIVPMTKPAKVPNWALVAAGVTFAAPFILLIVLLFDWSTAEKTWGSFVLAALFVAASLLGTFLRKRGVLPPPRSQR